MPKEKIEVGYKHLGGGHFHKYIVYTNQNNEKFIAHGGPETPPFFGDIDTKPSRQLRPGHASFQIVP